MEKLTKKTKSKQIFNSENYEVDRLLDSLQSVEKERRKREEKAYNKIKRLELFFK